MPIAWNVTCTGTDVGRSATCGRLERALIESDQAAAERVLDECLGESDLPDVLEQIVAPALVSIGSAWEAGDLGLSQVYLAGRLCDRMLGERFPAPRAGQQAQGRMAIGVLGDAHVLGKAMVVHVLRCAGYHVADWGLRLTPDHVVRRAIDEDLDVLMLSVLVLRSALEVRQVREGLRRAGRRTVLVVGGAPFRLDPGLGAEVGADHVGASAADILGIMDSIASRQACPWR